MPENNNVTLNGQSHLRVFRGDRAHCLDAIAERTRGGWHLTDIQRTAHGGYVLDFSRRRFAVFSEDETQREPCLDLEHAPADIAVDVIADRLTRGWRLADVRVAEASSFALSFVLEGPLRPGRSDA